MTIEQMKKKKRELGLTNKQVSNLSGVSLGTVNKIFSGATMSPRYDTIQKLVKVFDMQSSGSDNEYSYTAADNLTNNAAESFEAYSAGFSEGSARIKVSSFENRKGFILPDFIVNKFHIKDEDVFDIKANRDTLILKKKFVHKSFEERLADYGNEISIFEFDWGEPVGKELL